MIDEEKLKRLQAINHEMTRTPYQRGYLWGICGFMEILDEDQINNEDPEYIRGAKAGAAVYKLDLLRKIVMGDDQNER